MIRLITFLSIISAICCQYAPRHRAPPPEEAIPLDDYEDDRVYRPRAPPPPPRNIVTHKPASVHYVNIGTELAGDYKFGYDTGKGNDGQSFREETRLPDGTVRGAYGYVDESGTQRIVKYTAGKDGFKVEGDGASEAVSRAAAQPAARPEPSYEAPPPPAQPAYRPPPQQASRPPPQPVYRPPPQQAYRPPPQPVQRPQPQPVYRPAPAPQPARPPPAEYAPPPQPVYRAPPPPQRSAPRRHRPAPRQQYEPVESEPDYDYPDNEITERRIVPVDTRLFNYNIGTGNGKSEFLSA
ncbi:uncharacterized protein CEXT_199951 [Caerostris extrusa]|uniref:Cuticle protein n=1 Tax=Caerostris extrusa TaxID=172846 RepID=A0AAV4PUV9_CAEEX|nr:uncharacterized protein CEXT_199951 [Caerostris extrusa]